MPISMYQASVPVLINALNNLSGILRIAEEQAKKNNIDPSQYFKARLRPDVVPVFGQVQIVCDKAMICGGQLAGTKAKTPPLTETTFSELQDRINFVINFLQTITAEQVDETENKSIALKNGVKHDIQPYVFSLIIPKMYFHMTIAFTTLRGCGVDMTVKDFLGGVE